MKENNNVFGPYKVKEQPKFKGVLVLESFETFMNKGFEFGDSFDVFFSNGYKLEDVPFYNGYYTKSHETLICFHPGYKLVYVCYNDGPGMYEELKLNDDCTATIVLNTKGKYLDVQNSMQQDYSYKRDDYGSDEIFANFRPLNYGKIIPNMIYRSSTPIKNSENRAYYVNKLAKDAGINYIIDLSINKDELTKCYEHKEVDNAFWDKLYIEDKITAVNLSTIIESEVFKHDISNILKIFLKEKGPFLINCSLGKDRTGFICIIIETLMEASVKEIEDDFMESFINLHFIEKDSEKYKTIKEIKFGNYAGFLSGVDKTKKITKDNLYNGTINYLLSSGLTLDEIEKIKKILITK